MKGRRLVRVPSPAFVIACIALAVALGGSAYALVVTGKQIKDGTISSADVQNGSLTSTDIKNGTLVQQDFKKSDAPQGPAGAKGDQGAKGDAGPAGPAGAPGAAGGPAVPKVGGTLTVSGADGGTGPIFGGGISGERTCLMPGDPASCSALTLGDFSLTRPLDALSPKLLKLAVLGNNITTIDIAFFKPGSSDTDRTYKLEEVIVASESLDNSQPTVETVVLSYRKVTFASGGSSSCWDRVLRAAC
jgi:hypothetical protein